MKINYTFSLVETKGKKILRIELPKEIEIIQVLLAMDVQSRPQWLYESIDKVLNSESEKEEWNGNICGLEIRKDKTKVFDNLAEDGIGNWCEINTKELRELIERRTTER